MPGLEVAIARRAERRRGLITRRVLLDLGVSASAIDRRVRSGRLHRVFPGVYAVGHPVLAPLARELAALLACGSGSVLSHRSAAIVWRLLDATDDVVDVTLTRHRAGSPGIRVHQTAVLPRCELRIRDGLTVTSVERTLLDLAGLRGPAFDRALDEALLRRLTSPEKLRAQLEARRPGTVRLRAALDAGPAPTPSDAERRLLALIARAGLPRPQTNVRANGHEVDACWPEHKLVVEVDGYATHTTRHAFEADRLRDADHQAAGHRTLRITWRQLTRRPEAVAARGGRCPHRRARSRSRW